MTFTKSAIIEALCDEPKYRIKQALNAVYRQGISSWEELSVFPKSLRSELEAKVPLGFEATEQVSQDRGTIKAAIRYGKETIEAVLMRHKGRNTVCISSQAGCAMACDFCLTGKQGFKRQLSGDEIANQAVYFRRRLKTEGEDIDNIVIMGMGEPFTNYANLQKALVLLTDPELLALGARRISISTVGVVPGILKLAREPWQANLSVSLHAANDVLRSRLMPVNRQYPLPELLGAVKKYIDSTKRRVMIEYLLLGGINDSPADALALTKLLKEGLGRLFFVNLIQYNQTGQYRQSERAVADRFRRILEQESVETIERYRFGRDIKGACGQLAGEKI